jgi:very-short-patch-repair endonuclease
MRAARLNDAFIPSPRRGEGWGHCTCNGRVRGLSFGLMRKDPTTLARARELRSTATQAESKLWHHLRNRQLNDFKFARQEPIGPYIADFVCRAKKLVIEIDGVTHETPEELAHDAARTAFLVREGYRVIRFSNEQICGDLSPVLEAIIQHLR